MGIDVSDQVLRMVQLHRHGHGFIVYSMSEVALPENVVVEGEVRNAVSLAKALRELIHRPNHHHPSTRAAILCLPERKTFTKIIDISNSQGADFQKALQDGLTENIPMKLDEVYLDWQYVGVPDPKAKMVRVIVGVAPQLLVEGYLEACAQAGIIPLALEPESAALSRIALNDSSKGGSHLIVDLGATRTGLTIAETDLVAFSSTLPLSGSGLTATLVTKLGLTPEEGEQAKRVCGLDPKRGKGAVRQVLEPEFRPLSQKILESIGYYEDHAPKGAEVVDVTLVGGGANLIGLPELITSTVSLPVRVGKWPENITVPKREHRAQDSSYLTALGLAYRGALNLPWENELHV